MQRLFNIKRSAQKIVSEATRYQNCHKMSSATSSVTCHFKNNEKIAILTLNDPERLNALTETIGNELINLATSLGDNPSLRAVIITGKGKAFSAGGDLKFLMQRHMDIPDNNRNVMLNFYNTFLGIRKMEVPIIAAINGPAIGAGLCLALGGCDMRVAHPKAQLGLTFSRLGLHPGMAATHFLPQLVGYALAYELLLTGKTVQAEKAEKWGLINEVSEDPMSAAINIANEICAAAPLAVKASLKTLRSGQENPRNLQETLICEAEGQVLTYPTSDFKEGIEAIKEKRKPVFTGK